MSGREVPPREYLQVFFIAAVILSIDNRSRHTLEECFSTPRIPQISERPRSKLFCHSNPGHARYLR